MLGRVQLAGNDALERGHQFGTHKNSINTHMWQCCVTAARGDGDFEQRLTGCHCTNASGKMASLHTRDVVHGEY